MRAVTRPSSANARLWERDRTIIASAIISAYVYPKFPTALGFTFGAKSIFSEKLDEKSGGRSTFRRACRTICVDYTRGARTGHCRMLIFAIISTAGGRGSNYSYAHIAATLLSRSQPAIRHLECRIFSFADTVYIFTRR